MLKSLLESQRRYLNDFFDRISFEKAEEILKAFASSKGTLVFSGVGKSGHIAEKLAATFLSTGTRARFLNPLNALHGDIGFIGNEDFFICLSKSGASEELIRLIPYIKKRGAQTVAFVSKSSSKLGSLCDLEIVLPVEKEICPYGLAPTTSTAAQLIFGDALAVALMQLKNFSVQEFAENHPAGSLGRKITFKVIELMKKGAELPLCHPTDLLFDCLHELSVKRCGCLIIIDENHHLKGVFTDGDLRRAIHSKGPDALKMKISEFMTLNPKSIDSDRLALDAAKMMEADPSRLITVLPVLENQQVVGLIRMHDILQKEFS